MNISHEKNTVGYSGRFFFAVAGGALAYGRRDVFTPAGSLGVPYLVRDP